MRATFIQYILINHFAIASSWSLLQHHNKHQHKQSNNYITTMSAANKIDSDGSMTNSTLLISKMKMIGGDKVKLLLASQSPRRREILDMMGLQNRYTHQPSPLDEEALQIELAKQEITPSDYARILAERKAEAMGASMPSTNGEDITFIIGSDTIVDLDGCVMNKPTSEADAHHMLSKLSGNWHQVHTGVAVYSGTEIMFSFTDTTSVKFANLSKKDIQSYIASQEPMDKAGSYGIQGVGGQLVEEIRGDYFTVMGLPMHRLSRELSKAIDSLDIS